jgi:hypothetical protein
VAQVVGLPGPERGKQLNVISLEMAFFGVSAIIELVMETKPQ